MNIFWHFKIPHSLISEDSSVEYFLFIQLKGLKTPEKDSWGGKSTLLWVDPESVWRRPELAQEGLQSTSQAKFSCCWHRRLENFPHFPAPLSEIVSIPLSPPKRGLYGCVELNQFRRVALPCLWRALHAEGQLYGIFFLISNRISLALTSSQRLCGNGICTAADSCGTAKFMEYEK